MQNMALQRVQRIILPAVKCLALLLVLSLAPLCFGESVVVEVLNGGNGQPVPGQVVTMSFHYAKVEGAKDHVVVVSRSTGEDGAALFAMPSGGPEILEIAVNLKAAFLHCSCRAVTSTESVTREGLMLSSRILGSKSSVPTPQKPGHVIFVARPAKLFEKVLFD
jgi:hypothetical protein